VFCPGAFERIAESPITEVVVTDTLHHAPGSLPAQIRELTVAGLLGEAVQRIHEERSLSSLFV
jgi:ribose-phosphate pyrophosphokinase